MVANVSDEEMQEHYDNFFEDVFVECEDKYGEIEEMNVCDNLGDHLVGNVYIKVGKVGSMLSNDKSTNWEVEVLAIFKTELKFIIFSIH